jgi:hypothetical protein
MTDPEAYSIPAEFKLMSLQSSTPDTDAAVTRRAYWLAAFMLDSVLVQQKSLYDQRVPCFWPEQEDAQMALRAIVDELSAKGKEVAE